MTDKECGMWLNHGRQREQHFSVDTNFGIKGIGYSYDHNENQSFSVDGLSHADAPTFWSESMAASFMRSALFVGLMSVVA
ncbi:MAG TPA: hypothetical protein VN957_25775 [Chthoniobacterales bacterium]|nr:hypothetical protein [Chthoniobacterales bacterium]